MATVALEGISKYFGTVPAVQDLSCTIAQGEFLALLGPSGCGKTTTLLMLAGIYRPVSGTLRFDGQIVNDLPPRQRNIGMVFQSYALYPHLTVYENLAFPLRVQRQSRTVIQHKVEHIAALVQLQDLLQRKPAQLSGGQQQRVALGRALIKEPDLLLFDEPLSNLDVELRLHMRAEIKRLQRSLGITAVLVTHDQTEALSMADRILVLREGHLQQLADPHTLYHAPANEFVARFIGSAPMNFSPCNLPATHPCCNSLTRHAALRCQRPPGPLWSVDYIAQGATPWVCGQNTSRSSPLPVSIFSRPQLPCSNRSGAKCFCQSRAVHTCSRSWYQPLVCSLQTHLYGSTSARGRTTFSTRTLGWQSCSLERTWARPVVLRCSLLYAFELRHSLSGPLQRGLEHVPLKLESQQEKWEVCFGS
jgi:ABC-type sugar transport system ATPase subunit